MSAASPLQCCDVLAPPTALFNLAHLNPLVTTIGLPYLSLIGCNISTANLFNFSFYSSFGVLSIFNLLAVAELTNSS
jgi:hypothetical protein